MARRIKVNRDAIEWSNLDRQALEAISTLEGSYPVEGIDLPLVKPRDGAQRDGLVWEMDDFDRRIIGAGIRRFIRRAVLSDFPERMFQMSEFVLVEDVGNGVPGRSVLVPTRRIELP